MLTTIGVILFCLSRVSWGLNNGLALTPPMGWMTWERFRCVTDCDRYPKECLSEKLIKEMADRMVEDGYLAAGYEYLIIDDCWLAKKRDSAGNLQPDHKRFPSGMKSLSDYIHSKGLKFGLYEDCGTYTCEGYPGIKGHLEQDAKTFASWGVDYTKIDGCYSDKNTMVEDYIEFGEYLLATNQPIAYSCSWPVYELWSNVTTNFTLVAETCNLWRNYADIQDSWDSVRYIVDYFVKHSKVLKYAGPGHWNDPDMLIIGNFGLTVLQSRAQMAMWSILAAPLIMSHDMRNVKKQFRDILLNKGAIAINQDKMGIAGYMASKDDNIQVWSRPIMPQTIKKTSWAIAIFCTKTDGFPYYHSFSLKKINITGYTSYRFEEVFNAFKPFTLKKGQNINLRIPPESGFLFKVTSKGSRVDNEEQMDDTTNEFNLHLIDREDPPMMFLAKP